MKEDEIRPQKLMQKYIELSAKDSKKYFSSVERADLPCVACGLRDVKRQFAKYGFEYSLCNNCRSLYQTPRPNIESFEDFYRDSESSKYWAEVFFPSVAEARREKIFKPRVVKLTSICDDIGLQVNRIIDVGSGYGIFLEEWRFRNPKTELLAIEPSFVLAEECRNKKINVVESMVENVQGYNDYADLVVCFEVFEHVDNPLDFINSLQSLVRPGGYVFISTLCIDGFDLQILWDKSSQISPPHHINFLSLRGFELLFERAGLSDIRITTPGLLDVDIVNNFMKKYPGDLKINKFLKKILDDNSISKEFQNFLASNNLSSHVWLIGKKMEPSN